MELPFMWERHLYRLEVDVLDDTAHAIVVLFNETATALVNCSTDSLMDTVDESSEDHLSLPPALLNLIGTAHVMEIKMDVEDSESEDSSDSDNSTGKKGKPGSIYNDHTMSTNAKCPTCDIKTNHLTLNEAADTSLEVAILSDMPITQSVVERKQDIPDKGLEANSKLFLDQLGLDLTRTIIVMLGMMWYVSAVTSRYLSTDFVVSDAKGNMIHCSAKATVSYNFLRLKEGSIYSVKPNKDEYRLLKNDVYMLEFNGSTTIRKSSVNADGFVKYSFQLYRLEVDVLDDTAHAIVVLFNETVTALVNCSTDSLMDTVDEIFSSEGIKDNVGSNNLDDYPDNQPQKLKRIVRDPSIVTPSKPVEERKKSKVKGGFQPERLARVWLVTTINSRHFNLRKQINRR
nr:hypothetical protein [Tanacetum cinerariifolium]